VNVIPNHAAQRGMREGSLFYSRACLEKQKAPRTSERLGQISLRILKRYFFAFTAFNASASRDL